MNSLVRAAVESQSSLAAVSVEEMPDAASLWTKIIESSPDGWFWHTWANLQFNLVAAQKYQARNLSFFVMRDARPLGVVPLMVNRTQIGDVSGWEASYYGAPLPWPAFAGDGPDSEPFEKFALLELEARAKQAQAERIRLRLEPPTPAANEQARLERVVREFKYLDSSFVSHYMELDGDSLAHVRERYRRYVKKFAPGYEMSIAARDHVTAELEETYFQLHVKDAGGQFRSRQSYRFQADLARCGEAFFAVARQRAGGRVAGMLLISLYKGAAYDNSVAVDPEFQDEYVSHLLKWTGIEELLRRGARSYELGPRAELPNFMALPSEKNRGISYFKEGWARDSVRKIRVAEKFFSSRFLAAFLKAQASAVKEYFEAQ